MNLHNQCDNIINQCYFIFALWSIMELNTYCCLIFYGFILIHLTDPLSQVIQIMCIMCNIYKCKGRLLLELKKKGVHCTLVLRIPLRTEHILEYQWSTKMVFHGINQDNYFIYCHLMHTLMFTCDHISFKISSIQPYSLGRVVSSFQFFFLI